MTCHFMKRKIAIIGPYPPPFGGISVHLQRVIALLNVKGCPYDFYSENKISRSEQQYFKFYGFNKFRSLLKILFNPYALVHHHSPDINTRIILSLFGLLGKPIYLHIHGASLSDSLNGKGIKPFFIRQLMKHVHILADNSDIAQLAKQHHAKSVATIDAFLPPLYNENVLNGFMEKFGQFLHGKGFIISMVGWFASYKGNDLYGFDLAIEALYNWKKANIDNTVFLICSINGTQDEYIKNHIINLIAKRKIDENIYFIFEDLPEIWPLYLVSDVFIRPTCSDGSALSIKEAMWFDVPVIASDCVPRPEEVILFKNRSAADLHDKLLGIYSTRENKNIAMRIKNLQNKKFKNYLFEKIYACEEPVHEFEK